MFNNDSLTNKENTSLEEENLIIYKKSHDIKNEEELFERFNKLFYVDGLEMKLIKMKQYFSQEIVTKELVERLEEYNSC